MPTNLDDQDTVLNHKKHILRKPILHHIYLKFYRELLSPTIPKGPIIELGSGGGFLKSVAPKVKTSDIIPGPDIDLVFDATRPPFKPSSVAGFIMLNTLHHIKNPAKALKNMEKALKPKGKIIMVEPYNSLFSRFIYQNFHHETFDPSSNWTIPGKGRLSDANGALPWIIFVRDRARYQKKFPKLKIKRLTPHTPLLYLLSGGLSKPQLVPTFSLPLFILLDKLLAPLNNHLGMFVTIELQRSSYTT